MHPFSFLLLRESLHANLLIFAAKQAVEDPSLEFHTFSDTQILTLVHHLFARFDRNVGVTGDGLRGIQRPLHALLWRLEHSRRQTPLVSLFPAEILPRENQLHGPRLPNRAREPLRTARTRYHTEFDLGLSEVGFFAAVQNVAHHGELASAAERVAVDRADDGFADRVGDVGPGLDEVRAVGICEGLACHLFDISPRSEGFLRARDHHGADGRVLVEGFHGLVQFADERREESVESFGTVEFD